MFNIRKNRNEINFTIRSNNSGPKPYYYIKENFKFGTISIIKKKTTTNFIYILYNIKDIYLICLLLNYNPVILPFYKKIEKFFIYLNEIISNFLDEHYLEKIENKIISLDNY
jgi:hypothetical protein